MQLGLKFQDAFDASQFNPVTIREPRFIAGADRVDVHDVGGAVRAWVPVLGALAGDGLPVEVG